MNEDERFLRALVDSRGDDAPRRDYCEWLDRHDPSRGRYLRAEQEWVRQGRKGYSPAGFTTDLDLVWVARVSRPPLGVCCNHIMWTDVGPALTSPDVDRIEHRLGVALPAAYRAFLLNINGGTPRPASLPDPRRGPLGPLCLFIGQFTTAYVPSELTFGPDAGNPYYGLESEWIFLKELREYFPPGESLIEGMVPFASTMDDLGYLLLGVDRENAGRVFHFRDYCHNADDPSHLAEYAPTFPDFLGQIIPDPEE